MTEQEKQKEHWEDETTEPVRHMLSHRIPWLALGLLGGIITSLIVSRFEEILSADIRLAFFIPLIVYLSDAVGTQTESIYVRTIALKKINFFKYIVKESALGLSLGVIFGFAVGIFAVYWLHSVAIGFTVGITMLINLTLAPLLALTIPALLYREHADPALGAGPLATIIQDLISLLVYFVVAFFIILG